MMSLGPSYLTGNHKYISWITNDQVAWTLDASGMTSDALTEISDRPIPQEPMVHDLPYLCVRQLKSYPTVFDCQSGDFSKFCSPRFHGAHLSGDHEDRLDSCLPTKECDQHWL